MNYVYTPIAIALFIPFAVLFLLTILTAMVAAWMLDVLAGRRFNMWERGLYILEGVKERVQEIERELE